MRMILNCVLIAPELMSVYDGAGLYIAKHWCIIYSKKCHKSISQSYILGF